MKNYFANKKAIILFILPAFLIFTVFIILPAVLSVYYSLFDWNGVGTMTFRGLKNYAELFLQNKDGFPKTLNHAMWIAIASVGIQLPLSFYFASVLARGVRGTRFYLTVFFIPVIISSTVIAQLWLKIYNGDYGLLNSFLRFAGLDFLAKSWLVKPKYALPVVIVPILWQYVGYHMLLMYTAIKNIPDDIFDAARIDGASHFQIAWSITLPNIRPILRVCIIFAVVGSLKSYDIIFMMTKGGPIGATEVPTTLMVETLFTAHRYGYGSAMAVIIIALCFLCSILIRKFFKAE